jgi:hypothetical protein
MTLRRVAIGAVVVVFAGCLRLSEPDAFDCSTNADCQPDERCAYGGPNAGTCRPADQCKYSYECGRGEICRRSNCVVPECSNDVACSPYACDADEGLCKKVCQAAYDCASPSVCIDGSCTIDPCTSGQLACGAYLCQNGACRNSCAYDGDCAPPNVCSNRACVPRGAADAGRDSAADASDARRGTKQPGEPCSEASDCASGDCCLPRGVGANGKFCAAICEDKNPLGAPCERDTDCVSGRCSEIYTCTQSCTSDSNCGVNFFDSMLTPNHCDRTNCYPGCSGARSNTCTSYPNRASGGFLVCTQLAGTTNWVCGY